MLCFSLYSLQSIARESSGENCVETRSLGIKRGSSGENSVESRFVGIKRESSGEICVENSLAWYQAGGFG